ncbi:invasion associated locus B family protein [Ostreibacterium oceani]|uniref:Invasion protein IalB n=1 Tax=Ostreibacterium oceani TaxID=2654998 RepID=A0A6N7F237_9GAMM|nr:invasion associated locus B family protein [Ostreibacterium oceani]MPV86858.1 hypothetical protein [Ostreibacterium oceani]
MLKLKRAFSVAILAFACFIPNAYAVKDGDQFRDWEGKCETVEGRQFCGISHTIYDADQKPVVNLFIRKIDGQPDPIAFIKVPLGVNLQAGLGIAVDREEIAQVPYTVCDPAGCNAIVPLKSETVETMKRGKEIQIGMLLVNQEVILTGSLSGITKALGAL